MKIYRYFSHKSDILHYLIYHQEKPCVISTCFTLPSKSFKLTLTQADLATWKTTVTKKISTFLERGSQSSYIVNSLSKRNIFTK